MTVRLLPDVEALLSTFLRADADVIAELGDRLFTVVPIKGATYPLARLTRVGGVPATSYPLHIDAARVQFDVWGGPKATAWQAAETLRAVLPSAVGVHAAGVVTAVAVGSLQWLPDGAFTPERPRFTFDAVVTCHRLPA